LRCRSQIKIVIIYSERKSIPSQPFSVEGEGKGGRDAFKLKNPE